jgi:hypothetical protein
MVDDMVQTDLVQTIAIWATEVGMHAAQLPSTEARLAFLAEHHRKLVVDAQKQGMQEHDAIVLASSCVDGAKRIMQEFLARGITARGGRA